MQQDYHHSSNIQGEFSSKQIHFLLCGSCYWCASCFDMQKMIKIISSVCPICVNCRIKSLLVFSDGYTNSTMMTGEEELR
jgi:hypothetical protein